MIRAIGRPADGERAIYGLTLRGIAIVWLCVGVAVAGSVLGVIAWAAERQATRTRLRVTCEEGNRHHAEAEPQLLALIRNAPTPADPAQAAAQREALSAIEQGKPPQSRLGVIAVRQIDAFVQVIAPAYDCARRVAELEHPVHPPAQTHSRP